MELVHKAGCRPSILGVFPGSFNPPTRAHIALAHAALSKVDEVLFVLPRAFPHKDYRGGTLEERIGMLAASIAGEARFSVGVTDGGLFIEIARECRSHYPDAKLLFLCGRDAAERIAGWNYGHPDAFQSMLDEFELLVAPRSGHYDPPPALKGRTQALQVENLDEVSSTEVRERIRLGKDWRRLVPEPIQETVVRIYS
ncbi:MAG: nicotinate-nicotinamide nucleotide adenylyltransferase [Bryobacteraceae bacterium]